MGFRNPILRLSQLVADSITGATFQTATSGNRWVIDSANYVDEIIGFTGAVTEASPANLKVYGDSGPGGNPALKISGPTRGGIGVPPTITLESFGNGSQVDIDSDLISLTSSTLGAKVTSDISGSLTIRSGTGSPTDIWIPIPYAAGWADFGNGFQAGEYRVDPLGWVHLRGVVKPTVNQPINATIFAVPAIAPAAIEIFTVMSGAGIERIDVTPGAGETIQNNPLNAGSFLSLSGISWQLPGA